MTRKRILPLSLLLGALGAASGCTDHLTTQEAYSTCEELATIDAPTDPEAAFADCVACHEDCGGACVFDSSAPSPYSCPDDAEEGTGGAGGS